MNESKLRTRVSDVDPAKRHDYSPAEARALLLEPAMMTKVCTKCHIEYPMTAEFFRLENRRPGGLGSWCRSCSRADNARWFAAHPEIQRAANARWYAAHAEAHCAASARRYAENREAKLAVVAKWQAAHPEACRAAVARWRATHPEATRAYAATRYAIKTGRLAPSAVCASCGLASRKPHKHHEDYARPLDVIVLCPRCHKKLHAQKRRNHVA